MFLKRLYSLLFVSKRSEFYLYRSILGFSPGNLSLYSLAFVHGSCIVKDPQGNIINNERLEFLGDAVLNTIVSEMLYHRYPHENEGTLTGMRSGIVSRESLNLIADSLKLEAMIRANLRDVNDARNIGGNTLEALIGAIFLDRGYKKANEFVNNKIISRINPEELLRDDHNYKGKIIEISRKHNAEVEFSVSARLCYP
ncbi:MAG: ribonuclease III domain-containing protein, partial [Bacteroidota bacterium]